MYSIKLTPKCYLWIAEDRVYRTRIFVCTKSNKKPSLSTFKGKLRWFYMWQGAIRDFVVNRDYPTSTCNWTPGAYHKRIDYLFREAKKYLPDTYKGVKHVETTDPAWTYRV